MAASGAYDWGTVDMAVGGFTDEDRRRFERIDLRVEDILKRFDEVTQRVRDVEVDVDDLRMSKAERGKDQETRLALVERAQLDISNTLKEIKEDLEPLKAWRWKELGAVGAIVALAEFVFHVLVKG